ncbi:MAG: fimbrillin family protein [Rikenellaceae bacterium]
MKRSLLFMALSTLLFTSCKESGDVDKLPDAGAEVRFSTLNEEFIDGAKIGVFANDGTKWCNNNVEYNYLGEEFSSSTPIVYASDDQQLSFVALSPYSSDYADEFFFSAATDQSSDDNFAASDLMIATTSNTKDAVVPLNFEHQMSKIRVNVQASGVELEDIAVSVSALTDLSYSISDATVESVGSVQELTSNFDGTTSFEVIVAPQTFGSDSQFLIISIRGNKFAPQPAADVVLEAGQKYTCNIQVSYDQVVSFAGVVGAWDENNDQEGGGEYNGVAIGSVQADYYGSYYTQSAAAWQFYFIEAAVNESYGTMGNVHVVNILTEADATFDDGIPTGEFTLDYDVVDPLLYAPGMIVDSGFYEVSDPEYGYYYTEATINISKDTNGEYTFELVGSDGTNVIYFKHTLDISDIVVGDGTYISDMESNVTPIVDNMRISTFGDIESDGIGDWTFYMGCDGIQVTEGGGLASDSNGSSISGVFFNDGSSSPVGTYKVSNTKEAMTVYMGQVIDNTVEGSWYAGFENGAQVTFAPMVDGEMTITQNSDGTYTVTVDFADDNPTQSHTVKTTYTGEVDLIDANDNGDFERGALFYAGSRYSDQYATWQIELFSAELFETNFEDGYKIVFDILTDNNNSYYIWDIEGDYSVVSDSSTPQSIPTAKMVYYKDGEVTEYPIIDGDVNILLSENSKYTITLSDMVCTDGSTYNWEYINYAEGSTSVPDDYLFVEEGCDVAAEYYGAATAELNNWFFYLRDAGAVSDNVTNCKLALDLFVDNSYDYAAGVPTGHFEFVAGESKVGITTANSMSFYSISYLGNLSLCDIVSGSYDIEKRDDGQYDISFVFINQFGRKLSGEITTAISVADFS